ncbi:MAG: hypothetical protein U0V02_21010 [Anaerolineales bacterium]
MTPLDFGKQLRIFRQQSRDIKTGKPLTQQQLGELLREELGIRYSGTAVSDWERNKSIINVNDRLLLISLIKILKRLEGIKTLADANTLLEAGNYRILNTEEKNFIFPGEIQVSIHPLSTAAFKKQTQDHKLPWNANLPYDLEKFRKIIDLAKDEPPPAWPRITTAIMKEIGDWVGGIDFIFAVIWLATWLISYSLLTPSLRWPFLSRQDAKELITIYICASLILPLFIGLLTNTNKNPAWKDRQNTSLIILRLYTYQGAFIGFHVGYFLVFAIHLIAFYLQFGLAIWFQFLLAGFPLYMGAVAAHVIPDNLWRAYKHLWLSDGWIFFIFIILGPAWGRFFLEYYLWVTYPIVGIIVIAILLLTAYLKGYKAQNSSKPQ